MALKKSELYSSLWRSCDELRGGMDAIPSGAGIEFEPPRSQVSLRASDLG